MSVLVMVQKYLIALVWFPAILVLLIINLSLLSQLSRKSEAPVSQPMTPPAIAAASYGSEQVLGASIEAGDARSLVLQKFLTRQGSPLAEYAEYIVQRAQHYNLDYRVVPAIAMCESTGGKRIPSKDSYNAWGISVETGEVSGAKFQNWMHAIEWVTKYMYEKYYNRGIHDLIDIGAIYAPPSVANGNSWANCVEFFIQQIQ